MADEKYGGFINPQDASDFAISGLNSLLLGVPEGVARGNLGSDFLFGLPQKLVEAAGGKDALLAALERKSPGAVFGKITGSVAPMVIPGVAGIKPATTLGGKALQFGGQALAGTAASGVQEAAAKGVNPLAPENIIPAALSGVAGAAGGAALGAALRKTTKPEAGSLGAAVASKVQDISERSDKAVVANILGVRNAGMRKMETGATGIMSPQRILEDEHIIAQVARDLGVTSKADLPAANQAIQDAWNKLDQTGVILVNPQRVRNPMTRDIYNLPEVQKILATEKAGKGLSSSFDDILSAAAESPDAKGNPVQATLKESMDRLNYYMQQSYKAANNPNQPSVFTAETWDQMADAIRASRDYLIDRAAMASGQNATELRNKWKFKIAANDALTRAALNVGSELIPENSKTALAAVVPALFSGNPLAVAGAVTAGPVNRAITGGMNAIKGSTGLVAPSVARSVPGQIGLGATTLGARTVANPFAGARLASSETLGASSQERPEESDAEARTRSTEGFGYGLESGRVKPDGTYENVLDPAINESMEKAFDTVYKGQIKPGSPLYDSYWSRFKDAARKYLYRDGHLDYAVAAGIMFPNQEANRLQFVKSMEDITNINRLMEEARPATEGMLGGFVTRLDPGAPGVQAFNALRQKATEIAGGNAQAMKDFNVLMTAPWTGSSSDRMKALSQWYARYNSHASDVLRLAGVLR